MPATRTLNDGATNLSTAGNWSEATAPVDADTVIIPRGNQRINTFLPASLTFDRVEIAFNGRIESAAGAAWKFDVDNGSDDAEMYITGSGARLKLGGGTDTGIWNNAYIDSPGSRIDIVDVQVENLVVESGTILCDTDARVDALEVYGGSVTLEEQGNATTALLLGGTTTTRRRGTYTVHAGATLIVDVTDASSVTVNDYGGTIIHVNGDFSGTLKKGQYIDRLEQGATIDAATVGPGMAFPNATARASFTNTVFVGVKNSAAFQTGSV
jgi:hypothetical protein